MNKREILLTRIDKIEKDKCTTTLVTVLCKPLCVVYHTYKRSSSSYELYNLPFQTPKLGDFLNVL